VAVRAVGLGRQVFAVLGQHAPSGMDVDRVASDLAGVTGVVDVHDLHLWALTSGMNVATAHLVTGDEADAHGVLDAARDVLREQHGVAHATLQVEPLAHNGCDEVDW
jgi:cobalt-zinc-cadmium efflux system protein